MSNARVQRSALIGGLAGVLYSVLASANAFAEPATKAAPAEVKARATVSRTALMLQRGKYAKVLFMSPDGSLLVMSTMANGKPNQLHGISTKDGSFVWTRKTEGAGPGAFAVAPDGKSFFVRLGQVGHFVSTATGADIAKVKLAYEHYARSQIAAYTPDGSAVTLFHPTKTQRIDVAARKADPVVKLTFPGEEGRFRGKFTHIAGTDRFLLAESKTATVYQLRMGTTVFEKLMQLPLDKAAYTSIHSNNGRDFWALYRWKEGEIDLSSWGLHTADGTRGRQFDPKIPFGINFGAPQQLGASTRVAFGTRHGLHVGLVYDATKPLDNTEAILLGVGDPYGFVASKDGTVIAGVTEEGDLLFWELPAN